MGNEATPPSKAKTSVKAPVSRMDAPTVHSPQRSRRLVTNAVVARERAERGEVHDGVG